MNWKKIGLFVLFFVIGGILFWIISAFTTYISLFLLIFFIAYIIVLVLVMRKYSNNKLIILISLFVIYLLINIIPFPPCKSAGFFSDKERTCTCIGLQKHSFGVTDASRSQCVGIPINEKCFEKNLIDGSKIEIPCEN